VKDNMKIRLPDEVFGARKWDVRFYLMKM